MQSFEKPNVILPVSLHDASLSSVKIENDMIIFVLEEGINWIRGNDVVQTGKAEISFPKVDFDFCAVYCTGKDNYRKRWDIRDFAESMQAHRLIVEIIDETYGYNQAKFSCSLFMRNQWYDCEIEIYHFSPMIYIWED